MATSKWLLPSVPFPRGYLSCLQPIQEALQDQQVGLTHASFKLLLVYWDSECDILCVVLKSEVSVSYSLPAFPNRKLASCQS